MFSAKSLECVSCGFPKYDQSNKYCKVCYQRLPYLNRCTSIKKDGKRCTLYTEGEKCNYHGYHRPTPVIPN